MKLQIQHQALMNPEMGAAIRAIHPVQRRVIGLLLLTEPSEENNALLDKILSGKELEYSTLVRQEQHLRLKLWNESRERMRFGFRPTSERIFEDYLHPSK